MRIFFSSPSCNNDYSRAQSQRQVAIRIRIAISIHQPHECRATNKISTRNAYSCIGNREQQQESNHLPGNHGTLLGTLYNTAPSSYGLHKWDSKSRKPPCTIRTRRLEDAQRLNDGPVAVPTLFQSSHAGFLLPKIMSYAVINARMT